MKQQIPHYGDILMKVQKSIESCTTLDQLTTARRYADLFEDYCLRENVPQASRFVIIANVRNLLEDKLETIKLEELGENHETF